MKGDLGEEESLKRARQKMKDRDIERKDSDTTGSFVKAKTLEKTGF